jgi:P27 family predicted phage terminase small subunit
LRRAPGAGRKPKPTWLRVIEGKAGHRPLNTDEPQPSGDLSEAPDWMSESQQASWRYAIAHAPAGLLKLLDRSVLTTYIIAEDLHREAAKKIAQFGVVIKTRTGVPMQSPYMAVLNRQAEIMMRAAAEMGFTPSSRSRVKVQDAAAGVKRQELNRFAQLKEDDD